MAYFHNPAVILQNLYLEKLQGILIKRWIICRNKIPASKNYVLLFNMCHVDCCDLFPSWNMQTIVTIFLCKILSAALVSMYPLYWDLVALSGMDSSLQI